MESVVRLRVKVVPGASRSEVVGWLGDVLKVRVAAPPEKGKANEAVLGLLAKELGLRDSALAIVSGSTSQHKVVEIRGASMHDIDELTGAGGA